MIKAYDVNFGGQKPKSSSHCKEDVFTFLLSDHFNAEIVVYENEDPQAVYSRYRLYIHRKKLNQNIKVIKRNNRIFLVKREFLEGETDEND